MEIQSKEPFIELSEQVYDTRYYSFGGMQKHSPAPVEIVFGGLEHCDKDYRIDRKGFPVFLLEYVVSGEGSLTLDGQPHTLRKGCLYWYGPGVPCHLVNNPERPLVKHFIAFRSSQGSPEKLYNINRYFIGANRGGEQVGNIIDSLFLEACLGTEDSFRICCSYLDILLLKCARSEILEQHTRERAWPVFKRVKDYISDNYLELKRIDDIAAGVDLDPSYISRLFKRYYHVTPYNFLLQRKMEYALDLLRQGNMSVQKAAETIGFEDPFHFSRVFKKFKGISPSDVRSVRL
ncbi:AraC family transcriptional regulator [Oceanipulchritudo coccoides]|nr:AraC family transcriptional regulator [Oceanipulchritudo coccoides]